MMKYIYVLIFLLALVAGPVFGQSGVGESKGSIRGYIYDAEDSTAVAYASVKLLNKSDSSFVDAVSSSENGNFDLKTPLGKYLLQISFLGYHQKYIDVEISAEKPNLSLQKLYLKQDNILLGEAVIEGKIPPIQVKGDTIEFNPGAYRIDGSTVLKDLIKQIPGLEIDEQGSLKANGKAISKILVDGKEYFGNDIGMALTTLPANMIKKLQLFEKESEEAKATGIKDDNPEQVLNLDVKEEFKRSVFGDVKSGIGNKGRHTNRANVNKMHGDNQYSLVGDINNINDSEYKYYSNFDDNIDKSTGVNFNIQESEKITVNGSAKYSNYKSRDEYAGDSYSSVLSQYTSNSGKGVNRRQGFDTDATIDWKPDTLTTIYLRLGARYNDGENESSSMNWAQIVDKSETSTTSSRYSKSNGFSTSNSLMISRKLNDKGRNITLSFGQNYNKADSRGTNYSEKIYQEDGTLEVIDQRSNNDDKSLSYGLSARYVEPLGKANRIYLSYSTNFGNSNRVGDVRKPDPETGEYTLIDPDYFRITNSYSMRQNIRLGFQHTKEKYNFRLGFSVDPSYTRNKTILINAPSEDLKQSVLNYSPTANFGWKPNKDAYLNVSYQGATSHPSVAQLSSVIVIHNAMSQTVGNPDLRPSFNNNISLNFRKSNFETGRYFSASASYSYAFNSTVGYRKVDDHSNTTNTYRNVDGNSNTYGYVTFDTPLKNKKINVGSSFNVFYSKNIGFVNEEKNIQQRVSLSPSVYGRLNSEKVEASLNVSLSHNIGMNNLADVEKSYNTDYRVTNTLKVNLPYDFSVESNLNFSYRTGLGEGIRKDETMWNLSASKLFLKEKRGTLKFEFFDVLNDLRTQENTISGSDYSNYWRRVVNNYFMFSFSYRFNILQGGKS